MQYLICLLLILFPDKGSSLYEFKTKSIDGKVIDFTQYKGKKILIVNTASECGYTKQYSDLEKLSEKYKDKLVVIGYPANNFGGQEPGTNAEISTFCKKNYGVAFPMAAKVSVKGSDMAAIYHWLTEKSQNGYADSEVKWNFQKRDTPNFLKAFALTWMTALACGDSLTFSLSEKR